VAIYDSDILYKETMDIELERENTEGINRMNYSNKMTEGKKMKLKKKVIIRKSMKNNKFVGPL
jgi:hypothetical protein